MSNHCRVASPFAFLLRLCLRLPLFASLVLAISPARADDRLLWEFKTPAAIWSPLSSQGTVAYFGNDDGDFFALDTDKHQAKWQFHTAGKIRSAAAFYRDSVIFASDDGFMYVLNQADGKLRSKFNLGDAHVVRMLPSSSKETTYDYMRSSPVIEGSMVYIGSGDGNLLAIDLEHGRLKWKFKTQEKIRASAVIDGDKVCVGSWDHFFYCLNKQNGKELWRYDTKAALQASAIVVQGKAIIGGRTPKLFALDMTSGKEVWSTPYTDGSWVESSAVSDGNRIYVGSSDSLKLSAFDINSGKELWQFKTKGWSWMSPLLVDGVVYIGAIAAEPYYMPNVTLEAGFFAVDAASGALKWQYQANKLSSTYFTGGVFARPLVIESTVLIADLDGTIKALRK